MSNFVAIVGPTRPGVEALEGLWGQLSVDASQFTSAEDALHELRRGEPPDAVLISYPLWDMSFADLFPALQRIRRDLPIVIIAPEGSLHEVAPWEDLGVVVLSADRPGQELEFEVKSLLGEPAVRSPRFMVRMAVQIGAGRVLRACQSENISASGMLVRTNEEFPLGASIRMEFIPPGRQEPICGEAEVVRYTRPEQEGVRGMGIRFVSFEEDGWEILQQALEGGVL